MKRFFVYAGVAVFLFLVAACGGADERSEGDTGPAPVSETAVEATPSPTMSDEDEIRDVLDELAAALSDEDWSKTYDTLAPSLRATCLRGNYMVAAVISVEFAEGFIGEEAWDALLADVADGYEVQSIEVAGDQATVTTLENPEEPFTLVREDGRWWNYEEAPCSTDIFGAEGTETNECLDAYNNAVEEWNGLSRANDPVYQQYTIGGEIGTGFEGWAEDNGYAEDFCTEE